MSSSWITFLRTTAFLTNVVFVFPFLIRTTVVFIHKCRFPTYFWRTTVFSKMSSSFSTFFCGTLYSSFFLQMSSSFSTFSADHCIFYFKMSSSFSTFFTTTAFLTNVVFVFYFFLWTTAFLLMSSSFSLFFLLRTTVFLKNVVFVSQFFLQTTVFHPTPTLEVESDCSWGSWV